MTEAFDQLLARVEHSYQALVAQSWALLTAQTAPDDVAAIQTTCELQQQVILTGARWLARLEQVRALAPVVTLPDQPVPASLSDVASPEPIDVEPGHPGAAVAIAAAQPMRRPIRRSASKRRRRSSASTGPLPTVTQARRAAAQTPAAGRSGHPDERAAMGGAGPIPTHPAVPHPVTDRQVVPRDAPARVPLGESSTIAAAQDDTRPGTVPDAQPHETNAPRVYPLLAASVPPRTPPAAMAFHGQSWLPVTSWRRVFQHVLQTLQQHDPLRFAEMASQLTLHNGRPLFSQDPDQLRSPLAAGGGWYTTAQLSTDLLLQRVRQVLAWWHLPLTTLEVALGAPSATATAATTHTAVAPQATGEAGASANAAPDHQGRDHDQPDSAPPEGEVDPPVADLPLTRDPMAPEVVPRQRGSRIYGTPATAEPVEASAALTPRERAPNSRPATRAIPPRVALQSPAEQATPGSPPTEAPDHRVALQVDGNLAEPSGPPARPLADVRWVRTASGAALPLRPATNDE